MVENYSNRMYIFCDSVKNVTHYGVDQALAAAKTKRHRASRTVLMAEAPPLSISVQIYIVTTVHEL